MLKDALFCCQHGGARREEQLAIHNHIIPGWEIVKSCDTYYKRWLYMSMMKLSHLSFVELCELWEGSIFVSRVETLENHKLGCSSERFLRVPNWSDVKQRERKLLRVQARIQLNFKIVYLWITRRFKGKVGKHGRSLKSMIEEKDVSTRRQEEWGQPWCNSLGALVVFQKITRRRGVGAGVRTSGRDIRTKKSVKLTPIFRPHVL